VAEVSGVVDERLVERLAEDYGSDLVRFLARRVRTVVDAQDLAQEAYVRLLRLERKDLIRDPRSYLYRIASNVLFEFELRRKATMAGLSRWSDESRLAEETAVMADDGETLALRERLEHVMSELSPKCRAVLILHRREGMTYEEISARLDISASMVKKYLAKGLRHCRERLQDFR
jgi:RNA polymerase sigma-70 factor (ECF subfamily)